MTRVVVVNNPVGPQGPQGVVGPQGSQGPSFIPFVVIMGRQIVPVAVQGTGNGTIAYPERFSDSNFAILPFWNGIQFEPPTSSAAIYQFQVTQPFSVSATQDGTTATVSVIISPSIDLSPLNTTTYTVTTSVLANGETFSGTIAFGNDLRLAVINLISVKYDVVVSGSATTTFSDGLFTGHLVTGLGNVPPPP